MTEPGSLLLFIREKSATILWVLILTLACAVSLVALIYPFVIQPYSYLLEIGDVAPQDILAPRNLSYQSEILTSEAQSNAENTVASIYLPADTTIARTQIEDLRKVLEYIGMVRQDKFASLEQKIADIQAISDLGLTQESINLVLKMNDNTWVAIRDECLRVLEQIMRNTIREDRLRDAQRNVPAYISFSFAEEQTAVVNEIVTAFIKPNSLYSGELTLEAKQQAIDAVLPIITTFLEGETIVNRGQVITPLIYEALQAFELVQPTNNPQMIAAAIFLLGFSLAYLVLLIRKNKFSQLYNLNAVVLICFLFLVFVFGFRLLDTGQVILLYIYPLSAFSMTIAFLYSRELSMGLIPIVSIFAAFGLSDDITLIIYFLFTSYIGVLVLGRGRRIASFFWAGLSSGLAGIGVLAAFRLLDPLADGRTFLPLIGASFLNGIVASSFTLLFQFLFAQLLGITTPLRLLDISRPDHPLLQLMLREVPGTYQHSLQVANLAEQAADAIGADSLLVRVGALYHDAGKALNPTFFIENQVTGMKNPHDELDPQTSSKIITKHVKDGITLAKKFRLPPRLQDFMREHHGSLLTSYQYANAVKEAGNDPQLVDAENFRYPGPIPASKETALLMLADGVEARVRSILPQNETELTHLIQKTIDYLLQQGQLSHTDLTLHDLQIIRDSFVKTLKNTHHLRIQYPELSTGDKTGNEKDEHPVSSSEYSI